MYVSCGRGRSPGNQRGDEPPSLVGETILSDNDGVGPYTQVNLAGVVAHPRLAECPSAVGVGHPNFVLLLRKYQLWSWPLPSIHKWSSTHVTQPPTLV